MKRRLEHQVQSKLQAYLFQRERRFEQILEDFFKKEANFHQLYQNYYAYSAPMLKAKLSGDEALYVELLNKRENLKNELLQEEHRLIQEGKLPCSLLANEQAYLKAWKPYLLEVNLEVLKLKLFHEALPSDLKTLLTDEKNTLSAFSSEHLEENEQKHLEKMVRMAEKFLEKHLSPEKENIKEIGIKINNLYLCGKVGAGKTYFSKILASSFLKKGKFVVHNSSSDIFNLFDELNFLKKSFYQNSLEEKINVLEEKIEDLYLADLLVLDDLGTEALGVGKVQEYLLDLLKVRSEKQLPTIITSNLTLPQLQKRLDERITSRIQGDYFVVCFDFPDFRTFSKLNAITQKLKEKER